MNSFNRRQFLMALLAGSVSPYALANTPSTLKQKEFWLSAQGKSLDKFGLSSIDNTSVSTQHTTSQFRGHGLAQNPVHKEQVVMFARRPGRSAIVVNIRTAELIAEFTIDTDKNLQGHGCFSADGETLFTAETDSISGAGYLVARDTQHFKVKHIFESHGIGPHEIKLMPDKKTLVVANGGILTRPESGRKKLNLNTMQSSLAYIDINNGKLIEQHFSTEPKASIRHLDVSKEGNVAFAMQIQREAISHNNAMPLAGIHRPGHDIQLLEQPVPIIEKMNDYMGSVAINSVSRLAGFTSPKGNLAAFWNIDNYKFAGYHQLVDVCGLTVSADSSHFIISNSFGEVRQLNASNLRENKSARHRYPNRHWDNHMISVSV